MTAERHRDVAAWDDIRFWSQVVEDARRTLFCSPELESRVKTYLAARGLDRMVDVRVSPMVPDDTLFVADMNALEASTNQAFQRALHDWNWSW